VSLSDSYVTHSYLSFRQVHLGCDLEMAWLSGKLVRCRKQRWAVSSDVDVVFRPRGSVIHTSGQGGIYLLEGFSP